MCVTDPSAPAGTTGSRRHHRHPSAPEGTVRTVSTVSVVARSVRGMIIDCGSCTVRGEACADCVVTFLTIPVRPDRAATPTGSLAAAAAGTGRTVELDAAECGALTVLAGSGLVPPLRLERVV